MTVAKFMSKVFSYQDLRRKGGELCAPSRGIIRQKYPAADSVKYIY